MKLIAFYLPQFHEIPENNEWWGEGFTEWVNVKKAVSLFDGHVQPRLPLKFYNLLSDEIKKEQAEMAKKYGIYGFCYYHYWFDGKMLLQKPMEQMLRNEEIDISFCISWANEAWTRSWVGQSEVLIPQRYGSQDEWDEHFAYLVKFFKDKRYIKINNKPLFIIYKPEVINCLKPMLERWQTLARLEGFDGIAFAYQQITPDLTPGFDRSLFNYDIEFQPVYASYYGTSGIPWYKQTKIWSILRRAKRVSYNLYAVITGNDLDRKEDARRQNGPEIISYDNTWENILSMSPVSENSLPGAYVGWDDTPRKGYSGHVHVGATPAKFKKYLTKQIRRARTEYNSDFLFITAWNEWAEGSILEPDQINGYEYLEAVHEALISSNEFPAELSGGKN